MLRDSLLVGHSSRFLETAWFSSFFPKHASSMKGFLLRYAREPVHCLGAPGVSRACADRPARVKVNVTPQKPKRNEHF